MSEGESGRRSQRGDGEALWSMWSRVETSGLILSSLKVLEQVRDIN